MSRPSRQPLQFLLVDGTDFATLCAELADLGRLQIEPVVTLERTYLDSFDWRLHAAGSLLVAERQATLVRTCWRRSGDHRLLGQVLAGAPRLVRDLPAGPLRAGLEPLLAMRALLPMAHLQVRCQRATLLDKSGKTVLRVSLEAATTVADESHPARALPLRLRLEPVKGYPRPLAGARALLRERFGREPAGEELDAVLALEGRQAEASRGKLEVELQPGMPAGEAARTILRPLLAAMEHNLPGARQDLDSEFLHDFRVAVRRTRSLLSQVKGVMPTAVVSRYGPGFKWLGEVTGATRDLDVYLLKFPAYRASLPASLQNDLQPLHDFLVRQQRQEQRRLARRLDSARCRRLLAGWRDFLATPPAEPAWPERALQPIIEIANRRTWKVYRRVIRQGRALGDEAPAAALHELRISCKRLRYLMEFFQSLHPPQLIRRQIKALKALQDNLGDFQDLQVQSEALRRFARAMQEERAALPSETLMAMGLLIDGLAKRQELERQRFVECFARFARPANRQQCRNLFKPAGAQKEAW